MTQPESTHETETRNDNLTEARAAATTVPNMPVVATPPVQTIKSNIPFLRERDGKDGVIDVHFDGTSWCIEDESLEKDLRFTHLADAEQRASELSKETGRSVCVHGQDGELVDSFKTKSN